MPDRLPTPFLLGDVLRLERQHPCGGASWLVDRVGADVGLRCTTCGRHILVARRQAERRLAGFERRGDPAITAVLSPVAREPA